MQDTGHGLDTLRNIENVLSGFGNDYLTGNGRANLLNSGENNDTLIGGQGDDHMIGGYGDDVYGVEDMGDVVSEAMSAGLDRVYTNLDAYTLSDNVEEVVGLSSLGQALAGNALDNWLGGGIGNDTLVGGGGRDGLGGWFGNDVLTGGAGTDYFQFWSAPGAENIDIITDFNPLDEEIDLKRNGDGMFNALTATGWLDPAAFKVIGPGGAAVDANDRILYNQSTGQLYYDANGSGSGGLVQFATLTNHAVLTAGNFWVFDW